MEMTIRICVRVIRNATTELLALRPNVCAGRLLFVWRQEFRTLDKDYQPILIDCEIDYERLHCNRSNLQAQARQAVIRLAEMKRIEFKSAQYSTQCPGKCRSATLSRGFTM
jgi:hypothetical protein